MEPTVYVVDDDPAVLKSVCMLVESRGMRPQAFASSEEFLAEHDPDQPGCLVTDLRMLGMSGLDLQRHLLREGSLLPVIVVTGHANIPDTVELMQNGAVTLLEKPYEEESLIDSIRHAVQLDADRRRDDRRRRAIGERLDRLSEGEEQVLKRLLDGTSNKRVAYELNVALRTVEYRRQRVFSKLQVESVAELARLIAEYERLSDPDRMSRSLAAHVPSPS